MPIMQVVKSFSGKVILLSNNARIGVNDADSSILYRTELPRLLNNPDVTHINGIDKAFIKILGLGNAEIILRSLEKSFAETLTKIDGGIDGIHVDALNNSSSDLASKFNQGMIVMSANIERLTKETGKTFENVKNAIREFDWTARMWSGCQIFCAAMAPSARSAKSSSMSTR